MFLGNVNTFRKSLSKFKEIISQKYRREILCNLISNEISKLEEIDKIAVYIPEVNNDSSLLAVVYIIIGILFVVLLERFANKN